MQPISSDIDFNKILNDNLGVLAYFSHDKCSVCKTLKPKLSEYFTEHFPKIKQTYINIEQQPELAAKHSVFTVPVVIVFFEGSETYRKARSFGVQELAELVDRPYKLMFG
ncbi:MAG: thioredoxin family protein [Salinivirgaceae bacterium]|jgi:thioredoxin 1|nr:thioredoxin family protein [Salinivirgaceae bacterium]